MSNLRRLNVIEIFFIKFSPYAHWIDVFTMCRHSWTKFSIENGGVILMKMPCLEGMIFIFVVTFPNFLGKVSFLSKMMLYFEEL